MLYLAGIPPDAWTPRLRHGIIDAVSRPVMDADRERLLHGSSDPLPQRIPLRAGPLVLTLEAGDLRGIRLGSRELVRRIYGAVRDEHWGTVPARVSELSLDAGRDRFRLTYVSTHHARDVHFTWRADIEGGADGTIRFRFDGTALSTFRRNRIGLCVLHPIRDVAGHRARATSVDGTVRDLVFPIDVAREQPIDGFHGLAGLAHEVDPGVWAEITLDGDTFETEDQRNWIDASYKTYGTPLSLPIPVDVPVGTRVVQVVRLVLRSSTKTPFAGPPAAEIWHATAADAVGDVVIERAAGPPRPVPPVGLRTSTGDRPLNDREIDALRLVAPAHLRVDLRLADSAWASLLARAAREAARLGCSLELGLHLPPDDALARPAFETALPDGLPLVRVLVFTDGRSTTAPASLDAVRGWVRALRRPEPPPIGTGTTGDLYRINLEPPPLADVICWSMNPQVHASDVTSIAETPEGARDQVASVKRSCPGLQVAVTPITLRPGGEPDPRQRSLFAAGWTLAMLRALSEAGAGSLTCFETVGSAGLMDDGGVFPLFHVFAAAASVRPASVVPTSSTSDDVAAWWLTHASGDTLLLANLSRDARQVRVPPTLCAARLARIDAAAGLGALQDPRAFTQSSEWQQHQPLTLPPFGLARVDGERD